MSELLQRADSRRRLNIGKYFDKSVNNSKTTRLNTGAIIVDPIVSVTTATDAGIFADPHVQESMDKLDRGEFHGTNAFEY